MILVTLSISGCISKKKITLKQISIVDKQFIEKQYANNSHIKHLDNCLTKFKYRMREEYTSSDKLLAISFTFNEKYLMKSANKGGGPQYIDIRADNKDVPPSELCLLVQNDVYTFFQPTKIIRIENKDIEFDLKNTNTLQFYIERPGFMGQDAWKTSRFIITKDMINKLNL
jgi:hypothetical protein